MAPWNPFLQFCGTNTEPYTVTCIHGTFTTRHSQASDAPKSAPRQTVIPLLASALQPFSSFSPSAPHALTGGCACARSSGATTQVFIKPLPLMSTFPPLARRVTLKLDCSAPLASALSRSAVAFDMWMKMSPPLQGRALDAMRLAMLHVSPKIENLGEEMPTTPAQMGPELRPTLTIVGCPSGCATVETRLIMRAAASTASSACILYESSQPATAM
mmetsp:Transcript_8922/g.23350  ORF Transcript_8922/g.23350 Transcript_8922/m.23350 type:complete len:216 (-) Transcript_8922:2040-2687(-)